jgi:hypothetical protein
MPDLLTESLQLWQQRDTFAAIEHLLRHDDALAAADAFIALMRECYWKRKDLPAAILFGRAGGQHAFAAAASIEPGHAERAKALRHKGKGFFYDIGSFTWRGWDEAGITITPSDEAIGRDAARTNLRLAQELDRGDLPLSRARWLAGAHALAAGELDAARQHFVAAAEFADKAASRSDALLNHGYMHMRDLLKDPTDASALKQLQDVKADLRTVEYGDEFVAQLETALRVFSSPSPEPR